MKSIDIICANDN